jgi:XRE family aerobic/anaerobic benzoate catabolism transcriptional regulator
MKDLATLEVAPEAPAIDDSPRHPFLVALGERVRTLRSRRGMTRKAVALAADVSERHLANLEYGTGNS